MSTNGKKNSDNDDDVEEAETEAKKILISIVFILFSLCDTLYYTMERLLSMLKRELGQRSKWMHMKMMELHNDTE